MSVRPEDIASKQFATALRGANRSELRVFLRKVAREHRALVERASEAETRLAHVNGRLRKAERLLATADGLYRAAQVGVRRLEAERAQALERALAAERRPAMGVAVADQRDSQVAQVLREGAHEAYAIHGEGERWAEGSRRPAEQRAAMSDEAARAHIEEAHRKATEVLGHAEQRARQVLMEADGAAPEILAQAERCGQEVRDVADEEIRRQRATAHEELSAVLAETAQKAEQLRAAESQLRTWLESAAATIVGVLDAVSDAPASASMGLGDDDRDRRTAARSVQPPANQLQLGLAMASSRVNEPRRVPASERRSPRSVVADSRDHPLTHVAGDDVATET